MSDARIFVCVYSIEEDVTHFTIRCGGVCEPVATIGCRGPGHHDADILSAVVAGMVTSGERVRPNMSAFVSQTVHLVAKAPAKAGARGRAVRLPTDPAPRSPLARRPDTS
jgi:hypothetical protein